MQDSAGEEKVHCQRPFFSTFDFVVEDNRRGFDADEKREIGPAVQDRAASGNGLGNMARYLGAIGGGCEVRSMPGAGTKVIFSVPIQGLTAVKKKRLNSPFVHILIVGFYDMTRALGRAILALCKIPPLTK